MTASNAWYRDGSVAVRNGSQTVAGTNTGWLAAGVKAGDILVLENAPYEIASVEASDSLTLKRPYPGQTVAGKEYGIILRAEGVTLAEIALKLTEAVDLLHEQAKVYKSLGIIVDGDGDLAQLDEGETVVTPGGVQTLDVASNAAVNAAISSAFSGK